MLYYGDSMATCYWCDSNGGQIESSANALGASLPYSEVRDDPYDYEGAGAKKTATLRRDCQALGDALTKALLSGVAEQLKRQGVEAEPDGIKLRAIEDILPGEARFAPPSRLYASLQFRLSVSVTAKSETRDGQMTVSVPTYGGLEDWYELGINDGDNETVWISEADRAFEITFRRKGSGVGMSRRGAQVMARRGLSCWDILEYYYPGVSLRQLSLTADGADDGARTTPAAEPIARARLSQKARLYRQANDAAGVLTTLPAGANVDVFAVQADWAAIGSGGLYGFIDTDALSSFALTGVTAAQVKEETFASIGDKFVDVLQLPVESAKVLAKLSSGDIVRLNAYTDSWALVTAPGDVEGFIPRNALTLRADDAEDDGEIVTVDGEMTALLTGNAGLYVNADASVAPRRVLPKGSYLSVLAYNRVWAYVRLQDDDTGYVKLDSLSAVEAPPEPKAAPEGEIVRVRGEQYRVVAADALPLFESYSTDSPVLAILEKGKRVQLGAYSADWACVRVDGILGFVRLSGLADAPETAASDGIEGGEITRVKGEAFAEVTSNSAVLYATWSTGSEALASPAKGDRVQVGAYNARWACVRYEGVTGFMLVQGLKLL